MIKTKYLATLLLTITILSCNNTKKEVAVSNISEEVLLAGDSPIQSIDILYYNYPVEANESGDCDQLKTALPSFSPSDYRGILDATINDSTVLGQIKQQLIALRPATQQTTDNIILSGTINYHNGAVDQLCIGGIDGSSLFLNGVAQENNYRLVYLIKNNVGYYPWMIGDTMFDLPELKDNSFMKEPFVSSPYYKVWQDNRNAAE